MINVSDETKRRLLQEAIDMVTALSDANAICEEDLKVIWDLVNKERGECEE